MMKNVIGLMLVGGFLLAFFASIGAAIAVIWQADFWLRAFGSGVAVGAIMLMFGWLAFSAISWEKYDAIQAEKAGKTKA
jgi:hypothetical protein